MATRRRKSPARKKRGSKRKTQWSLHWPQLAPHQLDLLGLGLTALGVFLAFVIYVGASGGSLGDGTKHGLRLLLGAVAYAVPAALTLGGLLIVVRTLLVAPRPLRSGALCLFAAVALALAAGTFGLGPGAARHGFWHAQTMEARGGIFGEALYWTSAHLLSDVGAHILAVFLFLAGLVLVSGATVAGVLQATGQGVLGTGRRIARTVTEVQPTWRSHHDEQPLQPDPVIPPEPDTERLVVRATHVEAPSLDGAER
jgi:DNA segregation ATPase FtsK/SpoIIIE, S-DNA-T family